MVVCYSPCYACSLSVSSFIKKLVFFFILVLYILVYQRCVQEFKVLLAEVITVEACSRETEDGKTVANSWSTAKQVLKGDLRYSKMARKDSETLWRRYVEDIHRRQKSTLDEADKARSKGSSDSRRR